MSIQRRSTPIRWQTVLGTTPTERWGVSAAELGGASPEIARLVGRTAQLPPNDVLMGAVEFLERGRPDLADLFLDLAEQDLARLRLYAQAAKGGK